MANIYNKEGISFNNVKDGGKVQSSSPIWTGQVGVDEYGGIINAVDIDWNSAQWPNWDGTIPKTINATGDLIKTINNSLYS